MTTKRQETKPKGGNRTMSNKRTDTITIQATLHTTKDDSLVVLLGSVVAELEELCRDTHKVRLKVNQVKVGRKPLFLYQGPMGVKLRRRVTEEWL